ncbi:hypothetical protein ACH4TX_04965 [Streptomyces sp. NPDC021098]|uniref:hypothetical protein n=1 Tax=unclassified Streptomyces TaxID=2593676 RepID=UPI0037BB48BA
MTRSKKALITCAFAAALAAGAASPALADSYPDVATDSVATGFTTQDSYPDSPAPAAPSGLTSDAGR